MAFRYCFLLGLVIGAFGATTSEVGNRDLRLDVSLENSNLETKYITEIMVLLGQAWSMSSDMSTRAAYLASLIEEKYQAPVDPNLGGLFWGVSVNDEALYYKSTYIAKFKVREGLFGNDYVTIFT